MLKSSQPAKMPTNRESVKPSLREILADSHISAVAIAVLILWSLEWAFRALWGPLSSVIGFLATAVAILDIPYFSTTLDVTDRFMLITTFSYLLGALTGFASAWFLSRWVYGVGPLRSLSHCRTRLTRRDYA